MCFSGKSAERGDDGPLLRRAVRQRELLVRAVALLEALAADAVEPARMRGSIDGSAFLGPLLIGDIEVSLHLRRLR